MNLVIVWRIMRMTLLGPETPGLPADAKKELKPPVLFGEAVRLVAKIGGYLGRLRRIADHVVRVRTEAGMIFRRHLRGKGSASGDLTIVTGGAQPQCAAFEEASRLLLASVWGIETPFAQKRKLEASRDARNQATAILHPLCHPPLRCNPLPPAQIQMRTKFTILADSPEL